MLHLHTPVARHRTPSFKMSQSSTPNNNHRGGKQCVLARVTPVQWGLHRSGLSPQLRLHPPCPKFPPGGISFDRQWANINFYLCGFQVTLSGKVYWSFNLPEMAARLSNHFLLAQLRNLKCGAVAKRCEDTLPPASAVLSCVH